VIVGAAVLPTAPLLVPGVSASLTADVAAVCDAIDAALDCLPDHDVVVLVAAGDQGTLYDEATANLACIGRPDVTRSVPVDAAVLERLSGLVQYPVHRGEPLSPGLAVLSLLVGGGEAVVPLAVPRSASFESLAAIGVGVAAAVDVPELRAVVVAAGDLAAGLTERSPLHRIDGAKDFDAQLVDAVDSGRLDGLSRIGPAEAKRVGASGWAALAVLHGALARAKIGLVRRHYSAPRGVGYLVAHGA
jgi:hypothetical protein